MVRIFRLGLAIDRSGDYRLGTAPSPHYKILMHDNASGTEELVASCILHGTSREVANALSGHPGRARSCKVFPMSVSSYQQYVCQLLNQTTSLEAHCLNQLHLLVPPYSHRCHQAITKRTRHLPQCSPSHTLPRPPLPGIIARPSHRHYPRHLFARRLRCPKSTVTPFHIGKHSLLLSSR